MNHNHYIRPKLVYFPWCKIHLLGSICISWYSKLYITSNSWLIEKEMDVYSTILACEIPWTEEPGGLSPRGHKSRTQLIDLGSL